jgi:hypothetical protein
MPNISTSFGPSVDTSISSPAATAPHQNIQTVNATPSEKPRLPDVPEFLRKMGQKDRVKRSSLQNRIAIETQTVEMLKHSVTMSKEAKNMAERMKRATPEHAKSLEKAEKLHNEAKDRLEKLLGKQKNIEVEHTQSMELIDQKFAELEMEMLDQQFDEISNELGASESSADTPNQPSLANFVRAPLSTNPLQSQMSVPYTQNSERRPTAMQNASAQSIDLQGQHSQTIGGASAPQTDLSNNELPQQEKLNRLVQQAHVAFETIADHLSESRLTGFLGSFENIFSNPAAREVRLKAVSEAFSLSVLDPGTAEGDHMLDCLYTLRAFANHLPDTHTLSLETGRTDAQTVTAAPAFPIERMRVSNPREGALLVNGISAAGFLYNFIVSRDALSARRFEDIFFKPVTEPRTRLSMLKDVKDAISNFLNLDLSTQDGRYTEETLSPRLSMLRDLAVCIPPNAVFPRPAPTVGTMTGPNDVIDPGVWQLQEWGAGALSSLYDHLKNKSPSAALALAQAFTSPMPPDMRSALVEQIAPGLMQLPDPAIKDDLQTLQDCAMKLTMNNILEFKSEESQRRKRVAL